MGDCLPCLLKKGTNHCVHCEEVICDEHSQELVLGNESHCMKCYGSCKEEMKLRLIPITRGYLK